MVYGSFLNNTAEGDRFSIDDNNHYIDSIDNPGDDIPENDDDIYDMYDDSTDFDFFNDE